MRAECHFFFACCTVGEHDVLLGLGGPSGTDFADMQRFRDEGACVQERLEEGGEVNELFRAIVQAEQAGRFQYDAGKAQVCGEGVISAMNNCDSDFMLGDKGLLETSLDPEAAGGDGTGGTFGTGKVKSNDPCFFDFECATENSHCLSRTVFDSVDDFDSCTTKDDCRNGEVCAEGICILAPEAVVIHDDKICIPPIEETKDCSIDPDLPNLPSYCEAGIICMSDKDGDRSCKLPRIDGENCFGGTTDCERGLFCDRSGAAPECAVLKGEGDDCDDTTRCELGLFCDLARNEPTCEAQLSVDVQICTGIQGADDHVYDVPER